MSALRAPSLRAYPAGLAALAALLGGLAFVLVALFGFAGLLLPLGAALALVLLERPRWAIGLLVAVSVLVEREEGGLLPALGSVYDPLPGGVTAPELLLGLATAGVMLDVARRDDRPGLPSALVFPLLLLALAIVAGVLTGLWTGASGQDIVFASRQLLFLLVLPVLVFHVARTPRALRTALVLLAGLAVVKAALGLLGVLSGRGTLVEGSTITFYEPAGNAIALLVLLGVVAALVVRARPPLWLLLSSPILAAALALSLRRSFWIGGLLGLLLVVALASTPAGRRLALPAAALVALALWAISSVGFQAQGAVVERAQTLEPSRVQANAEDRYRFDERANVLEELARRPITGLGLAVPWMARHPVGVEHDRDYVHMTALWFWLKLGLAGLVAYLGLVVAAVRMGWLAWRGQADPLLRVAGLAGLCWVLALAVTETSGAYTGVDLRFTVLFATVLGLLAALRPGSVAPRPGSVVARPGSVAVRAGRRVA